MAVPPENVENTDGDGLGSFAVDLASQQAAARAAAGEADTEEDGEHDARIPKTKKAPMGMTTAEWNLHKLTHLP